MLLESFVTFFSRKTRTLYHFKNSLVLVSGHLSPEKKTKKNKIHIRQIATAIERNGQPTNQPQHHLLLPFLLTQLLCTNNVKLF